jgi:hypothetical protein
MRQRFLTAMRFRLACLLLFAAGLPALQGWATTYYVATNGVDTNPGTSTNAAWRTIQHAADTLAPGDTVEVCGGTYNEAITMNVSGNAAQGPVTFENYPGETPIVDGTGLSMPQLPYAAGLFEFTNASYVVVQGFDIRNYQTTSSAYVPAGIDITGSPHDLTFISNRIYGIANLNTSSSANAYGIAVHGTVPQSISNLVFTGNEIFSNTLGQSETFSLDGNVNGFVISGNRIHDNNNIGIGFIGYEGVCSDPTQDYTRNGVCRSNIVWDIDDNNNPSYPADDYSAGGIYSDGGSNVLIELNLVHDCDIGVEMASEHKGHAAIACVCRDNLIWSNYTQGISIGGYSTSVGQTWNCVITHNTLYHNDSAQQGDGELYIQFNALSNVFKDNIVVANSQNLLIGSAGLSHSTNTTAADWNLYDAPGGANGSTWMWNTSTYGSFSSYQTGTTNDAHSIFADPLFISATNSPAFNAGDPGFETVTNWPGETDIDLQPRIAFGQTDIGADELNILSPSLGITPPVSGQYVLELAGEPGHSFIWQEADALSGPWLSFLTNPSVASYWSSPQSFTSTNAALLGAQFFRAQMAQ